MKLESFIDDESSFKLLKIVEKKSVSGSGFDSLVIFLPEKLNPQESGECFRRKTSSNVQCIDRQSISKNLTEIIKCRSHHSFEIIASSSSSSS